MKKIISTIAVVIIMAVCTVANSYAQCESCHQYNGPIMVRSYGNSFNCSSLSLALTITKSTYDSSTNETTVEATNACNQNMHFTAVGNLSLLTTGTVFYFRYNITNHVMVAIIDISVTAN